MPPTFVSGHFFSKTFYKMEIGYNQGIRHLHVNHNAPYLPPPPPLPPKFCITSVFHFSWVLQSSQEKLKTILMQNFGGQIRCIMEDVQVAYRLCKVLGGGGGGGK